MTQSFFGGIGIEELEKIGLEASRDAIAKAHANGLPVTLGKPDGTIYRLYPDGSEEIIEQPSRDTNKAE